MASYGSAPSQIAKPYVFDPSKVQAEDINQYQSRFGGSKISKNAYDLENREAGARRGLAPVSQTTDSSGRYTTQYGQPQSASTAGLRNTSTSGASAASEGISSAELSKIISATGAGPQPTISRGNIAGEQAARDAAFARAKEKSGQIARSSLEGLRNSLGRRGITGGGYAQMQGAEALAPATDKLQDFNREQLLQDLGQSQHVADTDYQGQIAQRGQNQASVNALLSIINSRGKLY